MSQYFKKGIIGLFLATLIAMLWAYSSGYDNSINWEVTTIGEVIAFPAWEMKSDLMEHEIIGEKYLLQESYSGSPIIRNLNLDLSSLVIIWLGLCLFLVAATYLKRFAFFGVIALFAIFLNRLNLFEIGLFGIQNKLVLFIPFLALVTPLVVFHEYKKSTPILVRFSILLVVSLLLCLGIDNTTLFTDHFIAHSLFGFAVCALMFLFFISEEIIFSILYVVTAGKGGKSNHIHFLVLSIIYLGNIILYYLNKSGLYTNSFFFFDPFILLAVTSLISLWSIKYKAGFLSNYFNETTLYLIIVSSGIITFTFLFHQFVRGNDGVYEAFHYFILYFHIGLGALFFIYVIANFIDPLIKGFQVHLIVYKERNFPYATARLGGFFAVLAFYFLASQEPFNLLKSGYYNYLAAYAEKEGNELLAKEYFLQSSYLGYNTHYPNYWLGTNAKKQGADFAAKTYYHNAGQRFPSDFALINYGNLDTEINPNKVQAIYEEALRRYSSSEMTNNLGIILMDKGETEKALSYFERASSSQKWNDAPLINKWNAFKKLEIIDSTSLESDYSEGNFGVRSNILTTQTRGTVLNFNSESISTAQPLHRQAYILNSLYLMDHDSIESLARRQLANSSDATFNARLRKAIAIHLYKKGQINEAFMMLDYLQANAAEYDKGEYLDALGKLALDQGAYRLAEEFFDKAIYVKNTNSLLGKIESMARQGNKSKVPNLLLNSLKKNPELTDQANEILKKLESFTLKRKEDRYIPDLDSLTEQELIAIAQSNAFHEDQVIAAVNQLDADSLSGGYEILVEAIEINPYSSKLLKKYTLKALDWNLIAYAEQTLAKLQEVASEEELKKFLIVYETKKKALEETAW